jgi:hypothetical protein
MSQDKDGWVGIAFNTNTNMGGGDYVVGWGTPEGTPSVQQRHLGASAGPQLPELNKQQNLSNVSVAVTTSVVVDFTRALKTTDPLNLDLSKDGHGAKFDLLWAFGTRPSDNDPTFHGANHGAKTSINLFAASSCEPDKCPNHCSQHGVCNVKMCTCDAGYFGEDCSKHTLAGLTLPPGFNITYLASGVKNARTVTQSKATTNLFYVGSMTAGNLYAIKAGEKIVIGTKMNMPNGVVWHKGSLFVACAGALQ